MNDVSLLCPEFQDWVHDPPCPFHFVEADEVGGVSANDVGEQRLIGIRLFTASHIIAFYFTFPLYITMGVASYLYAMTRLPQFSKAVSFPLVGAIVGPMMILPNVGLNEWGHAFWFVDELFAAPLHWGFVTLGWCGLFGGTGGVAAQIVARMSNLCDVVWNNESKDCLHVIPY